MGYPTVFKRMEGLKRYKINHSFFARLGMAKVKKNSLLITDRWSYKTDITGIPILSSKLLHLFSTLLPLKLCVC